MRVLFVGDVVGSPGRKILEKRLPGLKNFYKPDLTIVNGENAAAGFGLTGKIYDELLKSGADVVTGGNHTWDMPDLFENADRMDRFARPANYPEGAPGRGFVIAAANGRKIVAISLLGRVFMNCLDNPFAVFDKIYGVFGTDADYVVDFHAEATSEKNAFGLYCDGRAAVIGTHTHVQTNDARFLPKGSFYLTDAGMCGALDSVIGMEKGPPISRFVTGIGKKFRVEKTGRMVFNGVVFDTGDDGRPPFCELINETEE